MDQRCQVIGSIKRGVYVLLALLILSPFVSSVVKAAPGSVTLLQTDWRTGEVAISWSGGTPGTTMMLYAATYDNHGSYELRDAWIVEAAEGVHVTQFVQNGQTIWYYVKQYDPVTDTWGSASNTIRQTPPITAYIINWPDMLQDLANAIKDANDDLKDHLDKLATPSDDAIDDLKDAIDELKNAVGAGQAQAAGNNLGNAINNLQPGMSAPMPNDGVGTFTGGHGGPSLPSGTKPVTNPNGGDGLTLNAPDPDSGTDIEQTMRLPYGVDMQGNLLYVKLFTAEQMDKLKWMALVRDLAAALVYILFGVWIVVRFAPSLKS